MKLTILRAWYALLAFLPLYGAMNAVRYDGRNVVREEWWVGAAAGAILAALLFALTWGVRWAWRAVSKK